MENLMGSAEFLTVVAVSGGVAYIAVQAHKRLLSDFMDKIHSQFEGTSRGTNSRNSLFDHAEELTRSFVSPITPSEGRQQRRSEGEKKVEKKKKVHFAGDVAEPSSDNKDYRRRKRLATSGKSSEQGLAGGDQMPMNRQVLYRGIIKQKMLLPQAG